MLDLQQKLEAAAKAVIEAAQSDVTVFTGVSADEKVTPRVTVTAQSGNETPQGSGNFTMHLMIEVRSNADDKGVDEHRAYCRTVLGEMSREDIADLLSQSEDDFHAFGFTNRSCGESVDDRGWVTVLEMDVYCAGVSLV
jgi:hypothetical protein